MPDLLLDFATYFTTENLVQGDGIDVFRDFTPEEPDDLVSIFEYSGAPVQSFNAAVDRSIQIVVRSKSPTTASSLLIGYTIH
jgi:hypothetical protein